MGMRIYNALVNKHPGIQARYHKMHDNSHGVKKYMSYAYLLWLNLCYYVFFCRWLGKRPEVAYFEEKNVSTEKSESASSVAEHISPEELIAKLAQYDVISFDIFDTLIFRPFSEPVSVFYFLQETMGILDFKRIRMEQEHLSRIDCFNEARHYETTLEEVWKRIEQEVGVSAKTGLEEECELEYEFCYANPYMLQVYQALQKLGKKVIITSDMYLPKAFLREMLVKNGYENMEELFISCEYKKSKANGELFEVVKKQYPGKRIVHVGDNEHSDIVKAKEAGFDTFHYPNVNKMSTSLRPFDMSPIVGSAYRGIVDNHLYQGLQAYSMEYEYGFTYGGLFVLGYCAFIHDYYEKNGVDKLLFLSRDGDILKQAYDRMYPEDETEYVYWSRAAATKLMAGPNRYDFIRRYLYHKINQNISLEKIFSSMELLEQAKEWAQTADWAKLGIGSSLSQELTDRNVDKIKKFLLSHYDQILETYEAQSLAGKEYYEDAVRGCKLVCAVDIGWAGSGAMSLSYLFDNIWKIPCELRGIIAGTNTVHNFEPDASESFLQSGKLVSYLYSMSHNRDLMKKHDLNKDYNIFWELLLASPTPQFLGFLDAPIKKLEEGKESVRQVEDLDVWLHFGKLDANQNGIKEVQKGILDFVDLYLEHFAEFPYMLSVSGRDAYAPMVVAASHDEHYLKMIEKLFALEVNVS